MPQSTRGSTPSTTLTSQLCEGVIEAGWLAALAATPLLFNPYAKQNFEVAKVAALRSIVIVMIAAWLIKVISGGRTRRPAAGFTVQPDKFKPSWYSGVKAALRTPLTIPAAAICLSCMLSTALSIAPGLSFWGSYSRFEGLLTQLTYVALFALVLMHLRTSAQWRRIVYVVVVSSVPVGLYALIQRLGIDPIAWPDVDVRVGSTLGNPIFLGAYLIMVLFITLRATVERLRVFRATPAGAGRLRRSRLVHAALLVGALLLQLVAFLLSQSRGPMLGLVAGCLIFFPTAWLLSRQVTPDAARPGPWSRLSRRARALTMIVAGLAVIASATIARPQLVEIATRTGLTRLASPLSFNSLTARTRMMIWRGAFDIMKDKKPLRPAHGDPDPRHRIRPLVGYGPETFGLALNRHLAPRLVKWEEGENTPDRAHNGVLEQLVTTGLIGFLSWTALYLSVFYFASSWLGLLPTRGRRYLFGTTISAGAVLGALVPALWWDKTALSAAGLIGGALFGLAAFLVVACRRESLRSTTSGSTFALRESLILSTLALIVGNLVETQFGIALAVTSVYLWVMLAVMVVAGLGWLDDGDSSPPSPQAQKSGAGGPGAWLPGVLVAVPGICLVYGFLSNWTNETSTVALVKAVLVPETGPAAVRAALWFAGWLFAMLFAGHLQPPDVARKRPLLTFKIAASGLCIPGLYLVWQCARLTWTIRARTSGIDISSISQHIARHYSTAVWSILVTVIVAGVALALMAAPRSTTTRPQVLRAAAATLVVGIAAVGLTTRLSLDPVRADTLLKHGAAAADAGRTQFGLEMIGRAAALAAYEPLYLLHTGRTLMAAARPGNDSIDVRRKRLIEAEQALDRARVLSPLDPDHTANIARCLVVQSAIADTPGAREALRGRAVKEYSEALRLRSKWPRVIDEYGGLLRSMGRNEDADQLTRKRKKRQ